jgi:hypothetical protein
VPPLPAPPQPRRPLSRRTRGLFIGAGALVLVVGLFAGGQTVAALAYDGAAQTWDASSSALRRAQASASAEIAEAQGQLDAATEIAKIAPAGAVDAPAVAALGAAATEAASAVTEAGHAAAKPAPAVDETKPFWLWDLLGARQQLLTAADDADAVTAQTDATQKAMADARSAMEDEAVKVFSSVAPSARRIEAANISAKTGTVVELRRAAAAAGRVDDFGTEALLRFTAYASAVTAVEKSQRAELAEKKGPLYKKRLAVEAFARSLSGGVLLDFNWKQIVNGYGWPGSMAGETSWNSADGGTSTILLSNSVAREWPNADSKALIAHEVGHSISAKCSDMFDWQSQKANEQWATAWAIGKGFHSIANGVQAYGQPPKAMVTKSKKCR